MVASVAAGITILVDACCQVEIQNLNDSLMALCVNSL